MKEDGKKKRKDGQMDEKLMGWKDWQTDRQTENLG